MLGKKTNSYFPVAGQLCQRSLTTKTRMRGSREQHLFRRVVADAGTTGFRKAEEAHSC